MKNLNKIKYKFSQDFEKWITFYNHRLILFNIILVFLFLLRSAGYFSPYFLISVNFIVIVGVILATYLLGASSRVIFFVTILFWIFAAFLKIVKIDVWAERTGIYAYETLVFGVILFIVESLKKEKRN